MTKSWLITGSSRGPGRQLAETVLAAGDRVVATARRPEQLDDLVQTYRERVRTVALDVTDPAAARAAVTATLDTFGRLDVLVNDAGYADVASIEGMPEDESRAQIDANFCGVVHLTRATLPATRAQGGGHIIQFSPSAAVWAGLDWARSESLAAFDAQWRLVSYPS
ncbi:SDR family NAD(P)-dependent oxidoreductase [Micromonospora sp. WMMD1155]|uniref:SDR family NAD(P)-dependent oxidoreductase n=1 Tax=Micromonospora sp. WMMD1155 TaxID=3016094 RepID=UPI00249A5EFD|nr:SDR family NAD(P)-dependent oxidoreductase [Micromonospora sp. WMMD1155]WFE53195.1 SDR family NAD(P)-dependent oxidoreductase [Micromonospora sp. WMMD1155]